MECQSLTRLVLWSMMKMMSHCLRLVLDSTDSTWLGEVSVAENGQSLTLPSGMTIETSPATGRVEVKGAAAFDTSVSTTPTTILFRRNLAVGVTLLGSKDYQELRDFFQKVEAKDQEPVVLTRSGAVTEKAIPGAN